MPLDLARRAGKPLVGCALGLVLGLVLSWLTEEGAQGEARFLETLERHALDLRQRIDPPPPGRERLVIIAIDQVDLGYLEYLSDLQQPWPWSRFCYAFIAEYCRMAGARAVYFDFDFSASAPGEEGRAYDGMLGAALAAQGSTYLGAEFRLEGGSSHPMQAEVVARLRERYPLEPLHRFAVEVEDPTGYLRVDDPGAAGLVVYPAAPFLGPARGLGAYNAIKDSDGVIRRVQLLHRQGGRWYAFAPLRVAMELLGAERLVVDGAGDLALGPVRVPIAPDGGYLIRWRGPAQSYRYIPAREPLEAARAALGRAQEAGHELTWDLGAAEARRFLDEARSRDTQLLDPSLVEGKVVLVGSTATGLMDLQANPFSDVYPGVEVHATVLDDLLDGVGLRRPGLDYRRAGLVLALTLLGAIWITTESAWVNLLVLLVATAGHLVLAQLALVRHGVWLDAVIPQVGLMVTYAATASANYVMEGRRRREIKGIFSRYLSPEVVNQVTRFSASELRLGGASQEITIYFSDIAGFTTISESLDPEVLVRVLNEYLTEMSDIILRHGGTLDKYIGDAVMAFWGAPVPQEDHARRAIEAALECRDALARMREAFRERGLPALEARAGINTGRVHVGNFGSQQRFSYTVMGDAVNLASRLEGANKNYGTTIMMGENTFAKTGGEFETRPLDLLRVKGKHQPVAVHEVLAPRGGLGLRRREMVALYLEGMGHYKGRAFDRAAASFRGALEVDRTDGPSTTYLERCESYRSRPPAPDWDGVYEMTTK
ncbi:MAG: adenylate/guanylate cyclase domain-containing protein [Planctomycetes bacterium]|nr:adenylate/guanylate cyclase domain-containing protein [Planctomycetota bacterium]